MCSRSEMLNHSTKSLTPLYESPSKRPLEVDETLYICDSTGLVAAQGPVSGSALDSQAGSPTTSSVVRTPLMHGGSNPYVVPPHSGWWPRFILPLESLESLRID
jgi:hypothetical protein